jgi:hypothetical protein
MADDIQIKLGVDIGKLFIELQKAINQLNSLIGVAQRAEVSIEQIDGQKVTLDTTPAQNSLNELEQEAEKTSKKVADDVNENLGKAGGASSGIMAGFVGGLTSAGVGTAIEGVKALGTAIFDGALRADDFGDKLEVAFSQQGIADVEGEINKVRESTLNLANDLGMPVERTRELAGTIATIGGVSGKQAEELTKLSAGIETFTDGTVKGEAVAKAFSRGLADPEGAAAIEALSKKYPQLAETLKSNLNPTEKLAAANNILGSSFQTVADQQADAGGALNKLQNTFTVVFEDIGSALYDIVNTLIPIFMEGFKSIQGIFQEVFGGGVGPVIDFQAILKDVARFVTDVLVAAFEMTFNVVKTVWDIAIEAFTEIGDALQPLIDQLGGGNGLSGILDGVSTVFTFLLNNVIRPLASFLIDVLAFAIRGISEAFAFVINAVRQVIEFFTNLNAVGAGVSAALSSVAATVKQIFDAVINLNWGAIPNLISGAFGSANNAYKEAYERTKALKDANKELSASTLEVLGAQKQVNTETGKVPVDPKGGLPPKLPKQPKGSTPKETESDLQELKRLYADYAQYLQNNEAAILQDFKGTAEERKNEEARLSKERAQKLKEYLNTQLADVKDFNANLSSEQLALKIKPDKAKKEDFEDIRSFYLGETSKLSKDLNLEVKVKLPDFKATIKDFDTAVKDVEKNTDNLVPKVLANSQEALDANTSQVTKYLDFIKSQNAEIEQAKTEALASGNIEAADSFDAQIQRNVLSINTLTSRLATYQTDSSKAIAKAEEESTLTFQLTTALQTNILDAFNSERIAKEREANEAIRAEKLGALDQEENDLTTSLAKREVSFEEYAAKMADIDKARQDAMESTEVTFAERLKEVQDKTIGSLLRSQSKAITDFVEGQFKDSEGKVTANGKIIGESMTQLTEKFATLAESGKATLGDFGNAAAAVAFDAVSKMIPSFVAGILGSSITALGPIAGPIAAGLLTASLQLLLGQAKAALGFKDGVVGLEGPGDERSDSIPAWLSKGESVITAAGTKANRQELEWMNNNPGMSIKDYFTSNAPQVRYSVQEDGNLIQEVRKLREETRGLGKQINRNTHVEISGALVADNNSIKAVIERDRRRNARRG